MSKDSLQLMVDVALSPCECTEMDCGRVVQPGDILFMYQRPGTGPQLVFPICAVHAAERLENMRLLARPRIEALKESREARRLARCIEKCRCDDACPAPTPSAPAAGGR